jgi:hypothetical protein
MVNARLSSFNSGSQVEDPMRRVLSAAAFAVIVALILAGGMPTQAYVGKTIAGVRDWVSSMPMFEAHTASMPAEQGEQTAPATVRTDKPDYVPGEYVQVSGTGWQPGEKVTLWFQQRMDEPTRILPDTSFVFADGNGAILDDRFLITAEDFGVSFLLTAYGETSGQVAEVIFRDGAVSATLSQCANGAVKDIPFNTNCANASDWVSGNLGASKSHYYEGDVIPYRLEMGNLATGTPVHTVRIAWDTTKDFTHA